MNSDSVTHVITVLAIGFSDSIPITTEQFKQIRAAKQRLMFGVGIEEKLDLVLENYAELERTLLDMALEHSIFPGKIEALLDGGTHLVNRRIANFVTTARLYLDQVPHDFSKIYGKDSMHYKSFKQATNKEYTNVRGYRVMEALRNHVQHRSLPTHGISFPVNRDETSDPVSTRFGVAPLINVAALEDDPEFKKPVLAELQAVSDSNNFANLLPFIREYAEAFGRIHQKVRDLTGGDLRLDDEPIKKFRAQAQKKFDTKVGLIAAVLDTKGLHKDREHLTVRPTKRRQDLERKNRHMGSLSRRYVSSMC